MTYVSEQRQHLVVCCVVGNEEAQVGLVQHGSDSDQTGTATGDDSDVLPGVLASHSLAMVLVVHLGDSLAQGLDAGGWRIFSGGDGNIDVGGPLETTLDVIFDLDSQTTQLLASRLHLGVRSSPIRFRPRTSGAP